MPNREYSPEEALQLLMTKLRVRSEGLSEHVQSAIDFGKDIWETNQDVVPQTKNRKYRKSVPYSHEEALSAALDTLQAYFVEQPLFARSVACDFADAAIGVPDEGRSALGLSDEVKAHITLKEQGVEKEIEIEIQTETQISRDREETIRIDRGSKEHIEEQRLQITKLRNLTNFGEE